jgi:hypothetical protein
MISGMDRSREELKPHPEPEPHTMVAIRISDPRHRKWIIGQWAWAYST